MAVHLPAAARDLMMRLFRAEVYQRTGYVEFPHQAECRLASEGWELTKQVVEAPATPPKSYDITKIRAEDYAIVEKPVQVMVPGLATDTDAFAIGEHGNYGRYEWRLAKPRLKTGEIAHNSTNLASFKAGKSKDTGMWATAFAPIPGATIDFLGYEYATSEHEFEYLREALFGGTKPLIPNHLVKYNRCNVDNGDMYIELTNGCSWGVRSWKNKDALRGGQITAYIFNEIYQLPGFHVYTGHSQNLRTEKGYTRFTSTPDVPWVKVLHNLAHGKDSDWHCTCETGSWNNPFSFSLKDFMRDCPDWDTIIQFAPEILGLCKRSGFVPRALMSREKFLVSHLGMVGGFIGRVYQFKREDIEFTPDTHPELWKSHVVGSSSTL